MKIRAKMYKIILLLAVVVFLFSFISCKDAGAQEELEKLETETLEEADSKSQEQNEQKVEETEEVEGEEIIAEETEKELSPTIVGSLYIQGQTEKVIVIENYAYVGGQGLKIIDITDKTSPTIIGNSDTFDWVYNFQIEEDCVYFPYQEWDNDNNIIGRGLKTIDITDRNNPILRGTFESDANIESLSVIENYIYATYAVWEEKEENSFEFVKGGIKIIDVTDKDNIVEIKEIDRGQLGISYIYSKGDYAYIFEGGNFVILDITDRENPQDIGNLIIPSSGWVRNFFIEGDYVYLPSGDSLRIIDIKDKTNPTIIGRGFIKDGVSDISVYGDYAFITYVVRDENYNPKESGMQVIDIVDKTTPKVVADIEIEGEALGISAEEKHVHIGAGQAGLKIVKLFN